MMLQSQFRKSDTLQLKKQGTIKSSISYENSGLPSAHQTTTKGAEGENESSDEEAEGDVKIRKRSKNK